MSKVIDADFGGEQPRQVLGRALKEVEKMSVVIVLAVSESGEYYVDMSEMHTADLCYLATVLQSVAMNNVADAE